MLLQIRDYIAREGMVSTQQLSRHFKLEYSALQPMLTLWENKGVIRKCRDARDCSSSCFKCHTKSVEYYEISLIYSVQL